MDKFEHCLGIYSDSINKLPFFYGEFDPGSG